MATLSLNVKKPNNDLQSDDMQQFLKRDVPVEELLIYASETNCSDLYLKVFEQPYISRFGKIVRIPCAPITKQNWMNFYDKYILQELNAKYVRSKLLDTSIEVRIPENSPNYNKYDNLYYRYRTSLGFSEGVNIATFRMIRPEDPTFENINYPEQCKQILLESYKSKTGITFFTGPTGSGKCIHKNTIIPTINGNKKLEDIQIGDIIFDKNGQPTTVIDKYCPHDPIQYELTFSDGTIIKAGAGHLWEVECINDFIHHSDTRYYYQFKENNIIYNLLTITQQYNTTILLSDFISLMKSGTNITSIQLYNFIYKYFKNYLFYQNMDYINIDLLITQCTRLNQQKRKQILIDYKNNTNKSLISNIEAKQLLKSKFIQLIRNSKQEYIKQFRFVNGEQLATAIINWFNNLTDILNDNTLSKIMTTNELVLQGVRNQKTNHLNFAIRRPKMCKYNSINLPIKPYWLGAWLGDGTKWEASICGTDLEVGTRLQQDYQIKKELVSKPRKENYIPITTWSFDASLRGLLTKNNLRGNKHIPDIYKIASIEDKLELIAGLIDTDGSVGKNGDCSIGLINKQIIESLREICCSLGFKCSPIKEKQGAYAKEDGTYKECSIVYSFNFYPTVMLPLQVNRKRNNLQYKLDKIKNNEVQQQVRHERFYIKSIEQINDNPNDYYCLAVDSSTHTFLCTESYIPTHNTTTLAAVMNTFTRPGGVLDNKVIITLEDPIEYIFHSTDSVKFSQKELDKDFSNFALGIKQALREHPNCINVGEARDKEVITAAIEASRTGHRVTTSFHASDVAGTVSRLLFHLDNSIDLAYDLILNLNLIMSQQLIKQDTGYLVDTQYLYFSDEVTQAIIRAIDNNQNIQVVVNELVHNPELQDAWIAKDWDYS